MFDKESIAFEYEMMLKKKNEMLKKNSNELNDIVLKFTNGQKILDNLLSSQKCVFDKGGIAYKPNLKQKYYKNYFVKVTSINDQIVCHYCNRNGHMSYKCLVKKKMHIMESKCLGSKRNYC